MRALAERISERAAGNPFFAEEIVRDLSERGVLEGDHGDHVCRGEVADISVPDTLQATIAARVDRLAGTAKQFLYAAAVIGLRFGSDLVTELIDDGDGSVALAELVQAELIDQVMFTPRAEYGFRHPLIQTVAYESQLKSGRAQLHRRMAAAIEARDPASADENAALIAEHLEAAGALHAAYGWHMRAGAWSAHRDIRAARASWLRARQVADRLPADDSDRTAMRIAPRTLLCGTAWQSGGNVADIGFDELRDLCVAADDKVSLAVGMFGFIIPGIDNAAHIGGALGGFAIGFVLSTPRARLMWREPLIRAAAALAVLTTVACFALMFRYMLVAQQQLLAEAARQICRVGLEKHWMAAVPIP